MNSEIYYRNFFHCILLLLLVSVCYSNTLQGSWHFDDHPMIIDNDSIKIQNLSWQEIKKATYFSLNEDSGTFSRPVAALTFALNYLYSGKDTTSYHVVNICLHLITSWLVYIVFLQTIYLYKMRITETSSVGISGSETDIALLGSVLWAIHPIHTQAVTYIVQRQAILAAMFYMLAMYCYIRARLGKGILVPIVLVLLTVMFYLLGLGSKQNAVMLPLALIGYEVAFFRYTFLKTLQNSRVFQLLFLSGGCIFALFFWLKGKGVFGFLLTGYDSRTFTLWERLITEPLILWKYIFLVLTPLSDFLSLESDLMASQSLFDPPLTIVAVVSIGCLLLLGLYLLKRQPIFGFAIFFFLVNHIVESTFIGLELYFEHRNYLPSIFIYFALSYAFIALINFYKEKRTIFMQSCFVLLITTFVIAEGNATYLRNDIWGNAVTLYEDAINKAPAKMRPYVSLASLYMGLDKYDEALDLLKQAEEMYKNTPELYPASTAGLLYYNSGVYYFTIPERRDVDKAISLLFKSSELSPNDYLTHMLLAAVFFEVGDYKQAEEALLNASKLMRNLPVNFYSTYGRVLYKNEKLDEAINVFQMGMEIDPAPLLRFNLVAAYIKKGDYGRAKYLLSELPKSSDDLAYLLGIALLHSGSERDVALEKLAGLMAGNGIDYCEWIDRIHKNKSYGIIYPDIRSIEHQLNMKYIEAIDQSREFAEVTSVKARECNLSSDKLQVKSTPKDNNKVEKN